MKVYGIIKALSSPMSDDFNWDNGIWANVGSITIDEFHKEGTDHKPCVQVKGLYTEDAIHFLYKVEDRYVRSLRTKRQEPVCLDSCVEVFMWPFENKGYVNFEINCGGTFLSKYYADPNATPDERHKTAKPLDDSVLDQLIVKTTMPAVVEPEISDPTVYFVRLTIPILVLESVLGPIGSLQGTEWRANFFKCGDQTSHPHWGSWNPIGETLNFHQPHTFGKIKFV